MKSFSGLFVAVCLLCAVIAFPTSNLDDEAEIVVVPLEAKRDRGIDQRIGDGSPFFSLASYNPYSFFDDFHNIFRQLRERVNNAWFAVPVDTSEPKVKTNSTSTVEYINGRKVVINDTFYSKETEFGTSVYTVRVIDFLPENDKTTSTTNNGGRPELDVESVDDDGNVTANNDDESDKGSPEELDNNERDNEIHGDIDDVDENFELDDDNNQQQQLQNHHQHQQQLQQQQYEEEQQQLQPTTAAAPEEEQNYTNNRLEEFMPNNSPSPTDEHSWESIEDENENVNESINMNEHYPVDLSNDIAINQMAADQGVPYDSDAEIFSFDEQVHYPISTTYEFVPVDIKK